MWSQEKNSALFNLEIELPKGICYVTISGPRGAGLRATLGVGDLFESPIVVAPVGETLWGAASLPPVATSRVRLEAEERRDGFTIGGYAQAYPSQRWRRVLPACLQAPLSAASLGDREPAATGGADKPLSADLAEIAANHLWGPLNGEDAQKPLVLFRRLAARPLDRSPGLGALAGALCQQGSAS